MPLGETTTLLLEQEEEESTYRALSPESRSELSFSSLVDPEFFLGSIRDVTPLVSLLALVRQFTLVVFTPRIIRKNNFWGILCFSFFWSAKPFDLANNTTQCKQSSVLEIFTLLCLNFCTSIKSNLGFNHLFHLRTNIRSCCLCSLLIIYAAKEKI